MVHELSRLTVDMQSLRNIQQQLVRSFGEDAGAGGLVRCPPRDAPAPDAPPELVRGPAVLRTAEGVEALVRSALLTGRISSALNLLHEQKEADADVFEDFRVTAGRPLLLIEGPRAAGWPTSWSATNS